MKRTISEYDPNSLHALDAAFSESGVWGRNRGRDQTRRFAECFHKHVRVPLSGRFSVLDIGCALGDSLPVWHRHYPDAVLAGADVSEVAVAQARVLNGNFGTFRRAGWEEIGENYDIIFCSNVLEHFENHVGIARHLLAHCRILYVMTPYAELDAVGHPLVRRSGEAHVATFLEDTFDSLEKEGVATVSRKIARCPVAWSPSVKSEIVWYVRYLLGVISSPSPPRRQIIYTMTSQSRGSS